MDILRDIPITAFLEYIKPYLNIIIALVVIAIIYYATKKLLYKLRVKGVITRSTEGTIKAVTLIVVIVIALPIIFSSVFQRYEILWLSIAIFALVGVAVFTSLHSYLENSLMYLIVVSSGIVKEGENIRIEIDGRSYTGRVVLTEGSHMLLRTDHSASVLIPYKKVFNAIIVKMQHAVARFMVKIYGYNLDVETLVQKVIGVVKKSKIIMREEVSAKILEISDNSITLNIEVGIMNPSSIGECYEEIVKNLTAELPYKIDIEVIE